MIRAAILGGTGYGAMELLRLSLQHPELAVTAITSRSERGSVGEAHPHLRGLIKLDFSDASPAELAQQADVLFLATPNEAASQAAHLALAASNKVRVVDLSGAHRLPDPAVHAAAYGFQHPHPERSRQAVYGLPECGGREAVRGARLVANPGCHASASLLATWPLVREGLVAGPIAIASVTGSSGSGASPGEGTHHPRRFHDFRAYRPLRHQHVPEIAACLAAAADGEAPVLHFVPHSAPFSRGIAVTAFVPLRPGGEAQAVAAFQRAYATSPLVRLLEAPPSVAAVAGGNLADIHVLPAPGLACVMVAIDNLGKGMAGTAVQNVNLMFGLPEGTGLLVPGAGP